jgi:hypothetical protein
MAGAPTPTPIPFSFQIVDDPNSNQNQVNGINQLRKIVGTYGGGQASNIYKSYTAQSPYASFRGLNYPGQGTVITSASSNRIQAGYVIEPNGQSGTYGLVRVGGVLTTMADPAEGNGADAVTQFLGINDSGYVVGVYVNASGIEVPFEADIASESFVDLTPPGNIGNAAATGISGKGDISGWETTSSGAAGFLLKAGTYYTFQYPGAQQTYALGLNWSDEMVGDYIDASGMTHGFLLIGPTKGGSAEDWQSIDAPNAAQGTWITGINNHHDICGYYVDSSGNRHGFVAVP